MKNYITCGQFLDSRKIIPQTVGNTCFPKYFALSRIEIVFIKYLFIFSVCKHMVEFSELVPCS